VQWPVNEEDFMKKNRLIRMCSYAGGALLLLMLILACLTMGGAASKVQISAQEDIHAGHHPSSGKEYEGFGLTLRIFFKPLPAEMPGSSADTPEKVALGRKLYFERGISLNKTQSCNDCHMLNNHQAGVDYLPTSKGVKGTFGTRNSPTVLNAGYEMAQFWDGRAADLEAQAKGPLVNPVEMAMRSPQEVVDRLKGMEEYRRAFAAAFPGEAEPLTFDNAARAIAAFERTLITPSRFDRYLKGDTTALTHVEERGLHRFVHSGCMECHNSRPMGGRLFQKFGVHHPYSNQKDLGRFDVTHNEEDRLVFKVPMLRNVTLTPPYFHDGQVATLPEAIRLMEWMQVDNVASPQEIAEIEAFLHSLEAEKPLNIEGP
jgi:cytochrome c peroxidase